MDAEVVAKGLTEAQRRAILSAHAYPRLGGELYCPLYTRLDVLRGLQNKGLLGVRPGFPLRKIGLAVREVLLRDA